MTMNVQTVDIFGCDKILPGTQVAERAVLKLRAKSETTTDVFEQKFQDLCKEIISHLKGADTRFEVIISDLQIEVTLPKE